MNKRKEVKDKAYSGKYVDYGNKLYTLVPELKKGMCEGCDLYNNPSCPSRITSLCTQGYMFKRVKA